MHQLFKIGVVELFLRFYRSGLIFLTRKRLAEFAEEIVGVVSLLVSVFKRIGTSRISFFAICRLSVRRHFFFEYVRSSDRHQDYVIYDRQDYKSYYHTDKYLVELRQEIELKYIKRYIHIEQRIRYVERCAVGKFQYLKPQLHYRHHRGKYAENGGKRDRRLSQLSHVGLFRRCYLRKVTLFELA